MSEGESGAALGNLLRQTTGGASPLGTITGLPPIMGAPLSGAMLGLGAGALYGGYKKLTADPDDPDEQDGSFTRRALIGALLGGGVGLGSGLMQSYYPNPYTQPMFEPRDRFFEPAKKAHVKAAASPAEVARILSQDFDLSYADKQRIMQALAGASPSQWGSLLAMAAGGSLTGYAASRILGVGLIGTMLASGAGALIARNMFGGQPKTFV